LTFEGAAVIEALKTIGLIWLAMIVTYAIIAVALIVLWAPLKLFRRRKTMK